MSIIIEGMNFTGFPGFDAQHLPELSYEGRVRWLRYRFQVVFLNPFRALLRSDAADCYVWLCVVSLMSAAVQALSGFVFPGGSDRGRFVQFLQRCLPSGAFTVPMNLDDPRGGRDRATTQAEHFYKFFRNGLAHSFCIEWGGLQHRNEVPGAGPEYLFEAHQGPIGERSLGVIPREIVEDFQAGVATIFAQLLTAEPAAVERAAFNRSFERVFMTKRRRPLP